MDLKKEAWRLEAWEIKFVNTLRVLCYFFVCAAPIVTTALSRLPAEI